MKRKKGAMWMPSSGKPLRWARWSGFITIHFTSWSRSSTPNAIASPMVRFARTRGSVPAPLVFANAASAIHHLRAAAAQAAILVHFRHVPPAAAAFQAFGARHLDPVRVARLELGD